MPLSVVAALAHLVVAASFARSGFFSPEGGVEIVVPVIYQAWIAAVAIALLTGGPTQRGARAASPSPANIAADDRA